MEVKVSKYQKFEAITIHRSEIKNADYNPRKIADHAQKGLRKSLKQNGLVETLVWNKRTGNLVGGHQRISQIDVLEKSNDYSLTVSCIDVDLKKEKEINIILNNPSTQGEYDFDILKTLDVDWDNTGFTDEDLNIIGIKSVVESLEEETETKQSKENIQAIKDAKKASKDKSKVAGENYLIITFQSIEIKESFLEKMDCDGNSRYIDGNFLINKMK